MNALTVDKFREHMETDLLDAALQRHIEEAEQAIIKVAGELNTETDSVKNASMSVALFLKRRASSITTVIEELETSAGVYEATTLAADDYRLVGNYQIVRLASGTNPRATWGDLVTVTYVPENDAAIRLGAEIDLVKLSVQYSGLDAEKVGDWSVSQSKYESKKNAVLTKLRGLPFA